MNKKITVKQYRRAREKAIKEGKKTFTAVDHEWDVTYAKYLLLFPTITHPLKHSPTYSHDLLSTA